MEPLMLNLKQLKEKGWTESAIKKFLGEPDKTKVNPYYKKASPMKLYSLEKIEKLESSEAWQNWYNQSLEKRKKLSDIQTAIIEKKRQTLISEAISQLETWFPSNKPAPIDVINEWYDHTLNFLNSRGKYIEASELNFPNLKELDEETLARWTDNFLRHNYTNYDYLCDWLDNQIGKKEAYQELRSAVDRAIFEYLSHLD